MTITTVLFKTYANDDYLGVYVYCVVDIYTWSPIITIIVSISGESL